MEINIFERARNSVIRDTQSHGVELTDTNTAA